MKHPGLTLIIGIFLLTQCQQLQKPDAGSEFAYLSQVDTGKAVSVMLTAYSTTLLADGNDNTRLRIAVTVSLSREITSATHPIQIYLSGNGTVTRPDGTPLERQTGKGRMD